MIDLRELRALLVEALEKAETRVIESVELSLPGAKEDEVTTLFTVEAERGLKSATDSGRVARAVRDDLESAYRTRGYSPPIRLAHVTDGLVARLRKQGIDEEKKTGGDFGLLLVEPGFDLRWNRQLDLRRGGLRRGALVQAKRRRRDGRWNLLTSTQLRRLPKRMAYTALLRYQFVDATGRRLQRFAWHPLSGLSISTVAQWLRAGVFPDPLVTSDVVRALSRGEYGTNDPVVIEQEICPGAGSYMVVEVDWEDTADPENLVSQINRQVVEESVRQEQKLQIQARG